MYSEPRMVIKSWKELDKAAKWASYEYEVGYVQNELRSLHFVFSPDLICKLVPEFLIDTFLDLLWKTP